MNKTYCTACNELKHIDDLKIDDYSDPYCLDCFEKYGSWKEYHAEIKADLDLDEIKIESK